MNGSGQGVLAVMALEKIGKDVIDLIADIERDLEAEDADIEGIREALARIANDDAAAKSGKPT